MWTSSPWVLGASLRAAPYEIPFPRSRSNPSAERCRQVTPQARMIVRAFRTSPPSRCTWRVKASICVHPRPGHEDLRAEPPGLLQARGEPSPSPENTHGKPSKFSIRDFISAGLPGASGSTTIGRRPSDAPYTAAASPDWTGADDDRVDPLRLPLCRDPATGQPSGAVAAPRSCRRRVESRGQCCSAGNGLPHCSAARIPCIGLQPTLSGPLWFGRGSVATRCRRHPTDARPQSPDRETTRRRGSEGRVGLLIRLLAGRQRLPPTSGATAAAMCGSRAARSEQVLAMTALPGTRPGGAFRTRSRSPRRRHPARVSRRRARPSPPARRSPRCDPRSVRRALARLPREPGTPRGRADAAARDMTEPARDRPGGPRAANTFSHPARSPPRRTPCARRRRRAGQTAPGVLEALESTATPAVPFRFVPFATW